MPNDIKNKYKVTLRMIYVSARIYTDRSNFFLKKKDQYKTDIWIFPVMYTGNENISLERLFILP